MDYNFIKLFNTNLMKPGVTAPLVCILALEAGTKIVLYTNNGTMEIIDIPIGHLFIMAGDCPHGGFAYLKTNARIHWYLEAVDLMTSDANQTGVLLLFVRTYTFKNLYSNRMVNICKREMDP